MELQDYKKSLKKGDMVKFSIGNRVNKAPFERLEHGEVVVFEGYGVEMFKKNPKKIPFYTILWDSQIIIDGMAQ